MTCLDQPRSEVVAPHSLESPVRTLAFGSRRLTAHYWSWLGLAYHTVFVQGRIKNANCRSGGILVG